MVLQYWQQGFAIFRNVFNIQEIEGLLAEANRASNSSLVDPSNIRTPHVQTQNGSIVLEKIDPVIDISDVFAEVASGEALMTIARRVLDDSCVTLFRDKLIYKHPGAPGYPLHQDYSWWHPFDANSYCTLAVCLSECCDDNGAIQFLCGTHDRHLLPVGERRALHDEEISSLAPDSSVSCRTLAGDVIAFHSLTVHWSGPNLTESSRPILYLSYMKGNHKEVYSEHRTRQTSHLLSDEHRRGNYFR